MRKIYFAPWITGNEVSDALGGESEDTIILHKGLFVGGTLSNSFEITNDASSSEGEVHEWRRADLVFVHLCGRTRFDALGIAQGSRAEQVGKQVVWSGLRMEASSGIYSKTVGLSEELNRIITLESRMVERNARTDSPIEYQFWHRHLDARHPELVGMVTQHEVFNGKYRLDFAIPEKMIAIELDGHATHSQKDVFDKDRKRQRELELAGWSVLRFSGREVHNDPADCVRQAAEWVGRKVAA